ncbi:dual specificity protein phosphatase 1-like [Hibiscus syriacus]|uniref:dual specificity protein phosphatase 1-like n=1 Tax=Hibiscus syriacus TaxID=106335 RepID=UPI0019204D5F|nr:dual specificity protein phosphatase 1-like [Hibiscus syriacus]
MVSSCCVYLPTKTKADLQLQAARSTTIPQRKMDFDGNSILTRVIFTFSLAYYDLWFISAEQCEMDKAPVLVHCMSGKNRSPAIVIAFLMRSKGWRLPQSYQFVKERGPSVDINQAIYQQLQEYKQKLFGSSNNDNPALLGACLPTYWSSIQHRLLKSRCSSSSSCRYSIYFCSSTTRVHNWCGRP